jgi:hypothetical protein
MGGVAEYPVVLAEDLLLPVAQACQEILVRFKDVPIEIEPDDRLDPAERVDHCLRLRMRRVATTEKSAQYNHDAPSRRVPASAASIRITI